MNWKYEKVTATFMNGWHRVTEPDESTVAYMPDHVTAGLLAAAPEMKFALMDCVAALKAIESMQVKEHGAADFHTVTLPLLEATKALKKLEVYYEI